LAKGTHESLVSRPFRRRRRAADSAKVKTPLESSILDDEGDAAQLAALLSEAEIVVGHIWRPSFPPAPRLRLLQSVAAGLEPSRYRSGAERGDNLQRVRPRAGDRRIRHHDGYPTHIPHVHGCLASAYALLGETERATAELAEARRLNPDDRYSSIARLKAAEHRGPAILPLLETTYYAGLRKAGMPEE
jgi:hypothetical protein